MNEDYRPMLCSAGPLPAANLDRWAVEFKWNGVRARAVSDGKKLQLLTRNGHDVTAACPEVQALAAAAGPVTLDGELVVLARGRPSLRALQKRIGLAGASRIALAAAARPVSFLAFDVLAAAGRCVAGLPYRERRAILEAAVGDGPAWGCPPAFPGADLEAVRAASVDLGLEGIVAKRLASPYQAGTRSPDWVKYRNPLKVVAEGDSG